LHGLLTDGCIRVGDRRRERNSFGVNMRRPIVTNGDGDALFPYFGEDLFYSVHITVIVKS